MRLVEHLIEEASGDFTVEADTPAQAAAILLQAHDTAREADRNLVTLPDRQARNIEPDDVVGNRVFCLLLDEEGRRDRRRDRAGSGGTSGTARAGG